MAESERKFHAAVQVVSSLPKTGSFQPTPEMMMNFYGNYKQAKEGPCTKSKPYLWDVVNKAKWEAWSRLGDISKEDAMENYVNALKQVIETMPDTKEASQFIDVLEPFYKVAYQKTENLPPVLSIFRDKNKSTEQNPKANGHIPLNGVHSDDSDYNNDRNENLNTSNASHLHNIDYVINNHGNNIDEELEQDSDNESYPQTIYEESNKQQESPDLNVVEDINNKVSDQENEDDEEDLFCDSLGPELLEEQENETNNQNEEVILADIGSFSFSENKANCSSLSDVEIIIERFATKEDAAETDKTAHVRFNDSSSSGDQNIETKLPNATSGSEKTPVVKPNQLGSGSGGGDHKEMFKSTSERKHSSRAVAAHSSDRSSRYSQRYRGRGHESDSDESPGARSDHNSSSERDDDLVIDKIADLLIEIQDDMRTILQRLKNLDDTLKQNNDWWFRKYTPSKTLLFLIIWPFVVNILFRFFQRRYRKYKS